MSLIWKINHPDNFNDSNMHFADFCGSIKLSIHPCVNDCISFIDEPYTVECKNSQRNEHTYVFTAMIMMGT